MALPDFEAWAIFASVADAGSFSGAAQELGLSKATVSKAISRLEAELGVSLFHRTSRRLALTGSGEGLIEQARALLNNGRQVEECGREGAIVPVGTVRLAAPMSFGLSHLGEPLARFLAANPQIDVDVCLSDSRVDLVADGFDIALRIGQLADSSLIARKLCDFELVMVAGEEWLARYGTPRHPAEIEAHQIFAYDNGRDPSLLRLTGPGGEFAMRLEGRLRANNADVMLASVAGGIGVAILPDFIANPGLKDGRFIRILGNWQAPSIALYLLTPPGRLRPRRVTALLEFLAETFTFRAV
jgi:DNA-binding transcriptional LysR family regulator